MDLRKLKKLIDLVEESGIAELEITEGEEKVRISRNTSANSPATATVMPVMATGAGSAAAVAGTSSAGGVSAVAPAAQSEGHVLKSPMVGSLSSRLMWQ